MVGRRGLAAAGTERKERQGMASFCRTFFRRETLAQVYKLSRWSQKRGRELACGQAGGGPCRGAGTWGRGGGRCKGGVSLAGGGPEQSRRLGLSSSLATSRLPDLGRVAHWCGAVGISLEGWR